MLRVRANRVPRRATSRSRYAGSVREATSEDDFVNAPVGSFLIDRAWAYFYPDEHLSGYVVWDRPSGDDFERLARILPPALATRPHPMLVDLRAMVGLDAEVFQLAARYTSDNFEALRRGVTKLALVRSGGVLGATAAGFFSLVSAFAPVAVFTDPEDALRWIDRPSYWPMLAAALVRFEAARHAASTLRDLRHVLDTDPAANLAKISAELAVSKRTLQRRLGELGTSLTLELARARVRVGQRLLAETGASVTEIAFQVGCKSPQHFSTLFKKATGDPPSTWREKQRARDR